MLCPRGGFSRGERVVISVRPERVHVSREEGVANALAAKVEAARPVRGFMRYVLLLGNGERLLAVAPADADLGITPGKSVVVGFEPGSALVYGVPAEGLKAEVSVE